MAIPPQLYPQPVRKAERNYAFVDSNNLYLGVKSLGWQMDFQRFRVYLREKYGVEKAFLFLGFVPGNEKLYRFLQEAGFICIFKDVVRDAEGKIKGNCDAELVLHTVSEIPNYRKAVIVSGDGDFTGLAKHLVSLGKLEKVIAPSRRTCSALFKRLPRGTVASIEDARRAVEKRNSP
jgi:uncharacterized LabA/DUF88 family protein